MLARILLLVLLATGLRAEDRSVYVWGNSLVHHLTDSDETTVPHWLALMADEAGHGLRLSGQWGFLDDFADLPPEPAWSMAAVEPAWTSGGFRTAGIDTVILAPPNYVQREDPDEATPDLPGTDGAAVASTARTLGWAQANSDARLLIYEGWAAMFDQGFPPSARGLRRWHAWNAGGFHDWHLRYVERLEEELGEEVGLIPAGSVLSALLTEGPLANLPPEALWSDDAPHGTATTYLLAAMVTYAVLYGEAPPALDLPATIHPLLRLHQAATRARVAEAVEPAGLRLGLGLAGVADYATQAPFLDHMKSARPFVGHEGDAWGAWTAEELRAAGHLSAEGWPVSLPPGVDRLEALALTDLPPEARSFAGTYVLRWEGTAQVSVGGRATDVRQDGRSLRFRFEPGPGPVAVAVEGIDPADPPRAMTLVREDQAALLEAGEVFNPEWVARVDDVRLLRFMDWMATNGSTQATWADRPLPMDATWAWRGVPVEVMVRLANETGTDPWFTLPHAADDAYARAFASYVHEHLDAGLVAHAEWSNEAWNWGFPQAAWAAEEAARRWGADVPEDAWMQLAGTRAAEVADVWAEAFADAPDRLVRVVAVHTGWPGLEEAQLTAPLSDRRPWESFDAYAVTGYFGHAIADDPRLPGWIDAGTAAEEVTALARAEVEALAEETWPYHLGVAEAYGLELLAYEGGTHIASHGEAGQDPGIAAFLAAYSYGSEMAALYEDLLAAWPGGVFAAYVDVAPPSRWGAWGALRHLDDANPRWDALMAANAGP